MKKDGTEAKRIRIRIRGIVQGVGFRPFVNRLAEELSLSGWVRNTSAGAELELSGNGEALRLFRERLVKEKPVLAFYESVDAQELPFKEGLPAGFSILSSERQQERNTLISPDIATCPDCLRELFDPSDRRYRHPFINCTNCGPRFTIIKDVPYDRDKTTMENFPMCGTCRREYTDIRDRRYHAQPVCCPDCGPRLFFLGEDGKEAEGDPIEAAKRLLLSGGILAVKGLGGFHLAALPDRPELAEKLRQRKHRDEKPFALMCRDLSEAERFCRIGPEERKLLESPARPIVLLEKKERDDFSWLSENGRLGIMLPYTPVHFLLLENEPGTLIMTSANRSELPMLKENDEALTLLSGIADGFLLNDRGIHVRCDDSVLWCAEGHEYFARRSRGYAPFPLTVSGASKSILACGAEQKASFALSKGAHVFPSQHIGDLKNAETLENYETQIRHFERLFDIKPRALVCDLHPDYLSTSYAEDRAAAEGLRLIRIQHHWAHMASCMADNGLEGPCIGIVWDGVGLGTDKKAWGGEFLTGDFGGFSRRGSLLSFPLPGGDRAVRETWRTGASLLIGAFREDASGRGASGALPFTALTGEELSLAEKVLSAGIHCPETTSIGRLFDGVSAILGIKKETSYEGQGAILLESAAAEGIDEALPFEILSEDGLYRFDWRPLVRELVERRGRGEETPVLAAMFMNTLAAMAAEICRRIREDTGLDRAVLSGGSFQNLYVLKRLMDRLRADGFGAYCHRRVSPNDEGLCLGQLMIARALTEQK